jgi:hypothetical protein
MEQASRTGAAAGRCHHLEARRFRFLSCRQGRRRRRRTQPQKARRLVRGDLIPALRKVSFDTEQSEVVTLIGAVVD